MNEQYPQDFFIKINSDEYREGRITINKMDDKYSSEIDIVQIETKKIWHHVGSFYNFADATCANDVLETSIQRLANFLNTVKG
ncbi:MAG: hypothetical protein KAG61_12935 [Bacteriovoracaceae bacterium]|nr:hypothetical protein [Bacteriovoracaceae bacterium]